MRAPEVQKGGIPEKYALATGGVRKGSCDIADSMKTTIDIADALLTDARDIAAREGTTLRALIEEGLREVLARRREQRACFELRDASFVGRGLQPGVDPSDWSAIASEIYEGRGT